METLIDKLKGTIYGQAIGDALGLGTEGMTDEDMAWKYPNGITHYSDIFQDRHRKRWKIGDWTDDTDMMLCIANAVVKDKGVNFTSIAQNFKDWAMGEPMGIGETTYKVLILADYVENPFEVSKKIWEMGHRKGAANGGLMRTSIVGTFPKAVEECAANICRLTHYDPRCVGSCVIISRLIHSLIYKSVGLTYHEMVDIAMKYDERIVEFIDLSLSPDIRTLELQDEDSVGYTLRCLAAALWAYWHARSFAEGLLAVVRAGGDADTNAAVTCAVAMLQAVDEDQQHKVQEALDWFAVKISVFSKEEQEAINACAIAFAERDQIVIPKVNIAVNAKCSQADLMAYASSAFFKIGKKRKSIAQFLCIVFEAYFPGGEGFVYKKMPGAKG